jgi:hypothetical protein
MSRLILVLFGWQGFLFPAASAQTPRYCLTVSELIGERSTKIGAYIEVIIDNNIQKADQDGNIYFTHANDAVPITVRIPNETDYFILGAGSFAVPKDYSQKINVLVRKATGKELAISQVDKQLKRLNIKIDQLDSIKGKDYTLYRQELASLDSIYRSAAQRYSISDADLRTATEKMQGRDKYFAAISTTLEAYLNEAKDIRDIFKHMLAFSLDNPKSFRLFDSTIYVYNSAYTRLNTNNDEYEKAVLDYWQSKELSLGFHNVFDFAINNIHRASIIPMNELLNKKVREYIHESSRRRQKELKTEIIATLNGVIPILDNSLTILEAKVRYYCGEMEVNRNIYSN